MGWGPLAVPDDVDGDVGGEDGAHVVAEVDEGGGALVFLGGVQVTAQPQPWGLRESGGEDCEEEGDQEGYRR